MLSIEGLAFESARQRIQQSLNTLLCDEETKARQHVSQEQREQRLELFFVFLLPAIFCEFMFAIAAALGSIDFFQPGLIVVILVVIIVVIVNFNIIDRCNSVASMEVVTEIREIVKDYSQLTLNASAVSLLSPGSGISQESLSVIMGHPHVSIISCWRNGQWQRIPSLNLVEGDIIALMGGDVTPGKVCELVPSVPRISERKSTKFGFSRSHLQHQEKTSEVNINTNMMEPIADGSIARDLDAVSGDAGNTFKSQWKLGSVIDSGEKILLRHVDEQSSTVLDSESNLSSSQAPKTSTNKNGSSSNTSSSFGKHRSLPADSFELLILSGDIRCFQMTETPIIKFCEDIIKESDRNYYQRHSSSLWQETMVDSQLDIRGEKPSDKSLVRKIFYYIMRYAWMKVCPIVLSLFSVCFVIRLSILETERVDWAQSAVVPIGVIAMLFLPIYLPLGLLIAEACVLGDILATTEATLINEGSESAPLSKESSVKGNYSPLNQNSGNEKNGPQKVARKQSLASDGSSVHNSDTAFNVPPSQSMDDEFIDDDEFLDEDIDERAEEIADEASTRVSWVRLFEYILHVWRHRLGITWNSPILSSDKLKMIRVPLSRNRVLETLGAVTMVCFVDDDIICEDYSVTEEIFLLLSNTDNENEQMTMTSAKGTILDLHANTEASGSRFENPMWWKYLPSLKPIGLNSMLTYESMMSTKSSSPSALYHSNTPPMEISNTLSPPPNSRPIKDACFDLSDVYEGESSAKLTAPNAPCSQDFNVRSAPKKVKSSRHGGMSRKHLPTEMEIALVHHIRKTIPLESLRELAGEIGFVSEDVSSFSKILEVNIVAPRLGDAQLLEDTHAWGQEETRRRGTLLAQVRSVIVSDGHGGLQMMSQGDPALILKYCREYWDGGSIAPLTAGDRSEVLKVYDRYRKEDFDVVTFSYTPIPAAMHPIILAFNEANKKHYSNNSPVYAGSGKYSRSRGGKNSYLNISPVFPHGTNAAASDDLVVHANNCLLFIDPTTAKEVGEQQHRYINKKLQSAASNKLADDDQLINAMDTENRGIRSPRPSLVSSSPNAISGTHVLVTDSPLVSTDSMDNYNKYVNADVILNSETGSAPFVIDHQHFDPIDIELLEDVNELEHAVSVNGDHPPLKSSPSIDIASQFLAIDVSDIDNGSAIPSLQKRLSPVINSGNVTESKSPSQYSMRRTMSDPSLKFSHSRYSSGKGIDKFSPGHSRDHFTEDQVSSHILAMQLAPQMLPGEQIISSGAGSALVMSTEQKRDQLDGSKSNSTNGYDFLMTSAASDSLSNGDHENSRGDALSGLDSMDSEFLNQLKMSVGMIKTYSLDRAMNQFSLTNIGESLTDIIDDERTELSLLPPEDCSSQGDVDGGGGATPITRHRSNTSSGHVERGDNLNSRREKRNSIKEYEDNSPETKVRGKSNAGYTPGFTDKASSAGKRSQFKTNRNQSNLSFNLANRHGAGVDLETNNLKIKQRNLGAMLWPLMRQQVFLGLAASSVPIKAEVPNLREDLTSAGVRFVYFSPRNMRRSKPVAEKIGIQFDWNCAISLRPLDSDEFADPHRYISSYADWDVHARMPHGVEAIKLHLQEVDNVPLLVSLYTDATPATTKEMIQVFKDYGEIVLTIGSNYRVNNNSIFQTSNISVSVAMIPGSNSQIPTSVDAVLKKLPAYSTTSLSRGDLLLTFRLVSLGSLPLLQLPSSLENVSTAPSPLAYVDTLPHVVEMTGEVHPQLRLNTLMENIRKGRIFLLNVMQVLAFLSISVLGLSLWPVVSNAIPISIPPSLPPSLAVIFMCVYFPLIALALLLCEAPAGVMKNTPRKKFFHQKPGDEDRFLYHLLSRSCFVAFSGFIQGWVAVGSAFKSIGTGEEWYHRMVVFTRISIRSNELGMDHWVEDIHKFALVQDIISCQMLLQFIMQAYTLLERGQDYEKLHTPQSQPGFYIAISITILTHFWIMVAREFMRFESNSNISSSFSYLDFDWIVWVVLVVFPFSGLLVGLHVNSFDGKCYRRYLQFLRLEFDTRLGMHSPR